MRDSDSLFFNLGKFSAPTISSMTIPSISSFAALKLYSLAFDLLNFGLFLPFAGLSPEDPEPEPEAPGTAGNPPGLSRGVEVPEAGSLTGADAAAKPGERGGPVRPKED
jgi:hypothetical protein